MCPVSTHFGQPRLLSELLLSLSAVSTLCTADVHCSCCSCCTTQSGSLTIPKRGRVAEKQRKAPFSPGVDGCPEAAILELTVVQVPEIPT